MQNFYSRPCGRGDRGEYGAYNNYTGNFYSRPCGRGDGIRTGAASTMASDFYSRPCGRGDKGRSCRRDRSGDISTHAPAGGATSSALKAYKKIIISTHAPAGGATSRLYESVMEDNTFLLTPLREGRLFAHHIQSDIVLISTHAPAGGATINPPLAVSRRSYFYSRPCGRGDVRELAAKGFAAIFLLTPLREGRPKSATSLSPPAQFLLTPLREGRRENRAAIAQVRYISTHAPAGGAT